MAPCKMVLATDGRPWEAVMGRQRHLSIEDREEIISLRRGGASVSGIARVVGGGKPAAPGAGTSSDWAGPLLSGLERPGALQGACIQ